MDLTVRGIDVCPVCFLDDDASVLPGHLGGVGVAEEALVFAGVGGEDLILNIEIRMLSVEKGEDVEGVGVEHQRDVCGAFFEQLQQGIASGGVGADAGSGGDGGIMIKVLRQRGEEGGGGVDGDHGRGEGGLHGVDATLGQVHAHQPASAPQRRFGGQDGTTHASVCAGDEQGVPVVVFGGFLVSHNGRYENAKILKKYELYLIKMKLYVFL